MANFHTDPEDKTYLYILYIDSICTAEGGQMNPSEVVIRWYADDVNDCSATFLLDTTSPANPRYCTFLVASFADVAVRGGRKATICLSLGDEHLAAGFLDIGEFSTEEAFKDQTVELSNAAGLFATAELHTAAQKRWSMVEVAHQETLYFVNPVGDDQAEYLYQHIVADVSGTEATATAEDVSGTADATAEAEAESQRLAEEEAKKKAEAEYAEYQAKQKLEAEAQRRQQDEAAEEQKRKREAEMESQKRREEEEDRRRREDEKAKQSEEDDKAKQREKDREREREEQRQRDDEDRRRRDDKENNEKANERRQNEELEKEKDVRRRSNSRWADEEKKRQEDEERWRQRQREREEEAKERERREHEAQRWQANRDNEHKKLEEEREKLRQDAKRERARETAERERRAQERKKNAEVTAVLLGADGGGGRRDSLSSRAPTNNSSAPNDSRAATPVGQVFLPDSRGSSPKRRSGNFSASAGSRQHTPEHSAREAPTAAPSSPRAQSSIANEEQNYRRAYPDHRAAFTEHQPQSTYTDHQPRVQRQYPTAEPAAVKPRINNASSARWPPPRKEPVASVAGLSADGYDSEDSNPFEGDALAEQEAEEAEVYHQPAHARPGPSTMAPRSQKTRTVAARVSRQSSPGRSRMAGHRDVSAATRLEHLKADAGKATSSGLWTLGNTEEANDHYEPSVASAATNGGAVAVSSLAADHFSPGQRLHHSIVASAPKSRTTEAGTQTGSELAGNPVVRSVLAAALQDVTSFEGGAGSQARQSPTSVAAVEEGLLRLLVLQKQLHVTEEPEAGHRAALADAAAGLVPRMLQVLDVAKGVCETNRAKLTNFCQERDMDLEKLGGEGPGSYLQTQLSALDKLHGQYASMLPGTGPRRPPALPSEEVFHLGFNSNANGQRERSVERSVVFQPNSRAATPNRTGTWSEMTSLTQSSLHGPWNSSPLPQMQATPLQPMQPMAMASFSSGRALQDPSGQFIHPMALASSSSGPSLQDPAGRGVHTLLDPAGRGPCAPFLQGGGSSPPPAKFRELRAHGPSSSPTLPMPSSGLVPMLDPGATPDQHATWSGPTSRSARRLENSAAWNGGLANAETSFGWGAVAASGTHPHSSPHEFAHSASGASTPLRDVSPAAHPRAYPNAHLPQRLLALQQLRVAEESTGPTRRPASRQRNAHASPGGAHAAAGSPSPERRHRMPEAEQVEDMEPIPDKGPTGPVFSSTSRLSSRGRAQFQDERPGGPGKPKAGAPEDKYFKILQNLQAKGAVGVRGKLSEAVGLRERKGRENRSNALGDSASASRPEFSRAWAPLSRRTSPVTASSRPSRRHRLAADSESEDSQE